jgi:hypothetical protein
MVSGDHKTFSGADGSPDDGVFCGKREESAGSVS